MNEIPAKLKQLRAEKHITQKAVALYLETTQQAYSNYESGKRELPIRYVNKLAEYYQVSADYILGIRTDFEGNTDLSTPFINQIPLSDIVRDLQALHKQNRAIVAHYIHLLRRSQGTSENSRSLPEKD